MRQVRVALLLAGTVFCGACFQFSTVLTVKPDGSGTIEQRLLFTQAAVAQLRQLAAFGGGQDFDPVSEQQARDGAGTLGAGVTYVSSAPVNNSDGVGRDITYAFTDINTLKLDQAPPPPGGVSAGAPAADSDQQVTFNLTRLPNGHALLTIKTPRLPAVSGDPSQPSNAPSADQLAMLKPMLADARVSMAVEAVGTLVRTSSPYVTGRRVTLLEVNLDALLADETILRKMQEARTPEAAKELLKSVPGLKANFDPELTIEFQ